MRTALAAIALFLIWSLVVWRAGYKSGESNVGELVRVDTVTHIEIVRDTIEGPVQEIVIPISTPVFVRDTVIEYRGLDTPVPVNQYTMSHRDSLVSIVVSGSVAGWLLEMDIDYTPFIQREIIRETIEIERTVMASRRKLGVGVHADGVFIPGYYQDVLLGPSISYQEGILRGYYSPRYSVSHGSVGHMFGISVNF